MASWNDLVAYVRNTYVVSNDHDRLLVLEFELDGGRSQVIVLRPERLMDGEEDWVMMSSAIGSDDEVNLRAALSQVGDMVCGGLAIHDGFVILRHAVPLENLDVNEFERPLALVTTSADRLEKMLVGHDRN